MTKYALQLWNIYLSVKQYVILFGMCLKKFLIISITSAYSKWQQYSYFFKVCSLVKLIRPSNSTEIDTRFKGETYNLNNNNQHVLIPLCGLVSKYTGCVSMSNIPQGEANLHQLLWTRIRWYLIYSPLTAVISPHKWEIRSMVCV